VPITRATIAIGKGPTLTKEKKKKENIYET
jgi:hypothetical protein